MLPSSGALVLPLLDQELLVGLLVVEPPKGRPLKGGLVAVGTYSCLFLHGCICVPAPHNCLCGIYGLFCFCYNTCAICPCVALLPHLTNRCPCLHLWPCYVCCNICESCQSHFMRVNLVSCSALSPLTPPHSCPAPPFTICTRLPPLSPWLRPLSPPSLHPLCPHPLPARTAPLLQPYPSVTGTRSPTV